MTTVASACHVTACMCFMTALALQEESAAYCAVSVVVAPIVVSTPSWDSPITKHVVASKNSTRCVVVDEVLIPLRVAGPNSSAVRTDERIEGLDSDATENGGEKT